MPARPGDLLRRQLRDHREHDARVTRGEHGPAVDRAQRRPQVRGLLLRGEGIGRAGAWRCHDPRPANEQPELLAGELPGPSQQREALEDGLHVPQGLPGEDVADCLAIALLVLHDGEQRRAGPTAGVEQVIERRERRRLGRGQVRGALGHGGRIPTSSSPRIPPALPAVSSRSQARRRARRNPAAGAASRASRRRARS